MLDDRAHAHEIDEPAADDFAGALDEAWAMLRAQSCPLAEGWGHLPDHAFFGSRITMTVWISRFARVEVCVGWVAGRGAAVRTLAKLDPVLCETPEEAEQAARDAMLAAALIRTAEKLARPDMDRHTFAAAVDFWIDCQKHRRGAA